MTFSIRFHPDVKHEIRASYLWYESQSEGLGDCLLRELEDSFTLIQEAPHIWPKKREVFSRYVVQRFPFSIYYAVEDNTIIVYAVAHTSREPYYWDERKDTK